MGLFLDYYVPKDFVHQQYEELKNTKILREDHMLMGSLQVFLFWISLQILFELHKTLTLRWVLSATLQIFLEFLISTPCLLQNNTTWKKHIMAIRSSGDTFPLGKCWEISLQNAEVNSKLSIILSWFLSQIAPRAKEQKWPRFSCDIDIRFKQIGSQFQKTCESRHINSLYNSGQIIYLDLSRGHHFDGGWVRDSPQRCP